MHGLYLLTLRYESTQIVARLLYVQVLNQTEEVQLDALELLVCVPIVRRHYTFHVKVVKILHLRARNGKARTVLDFDRGIIIFLLTNLHLALEESWRDVIRFRFPTQMPTRNMLRVSLSTRVKYLLVGV